VSQKLGKVFANDLVEFVVSCFFMFLRFQCFCHSSEFLTKLSNNINMIRNYLKIALRSLWKNKLFSFVTIIGLALSMAVSVALLMQLKMHYDTDHFHPHLNRTFRLLTHETTTDKISLWASVPMPLVSALQNVSFIEKTVTVQQQGFHNLQTDKGDISVEITYTEPAFFEIFGFKLLSGNAQNALTSPNSVLLAEKTAQRIFGNKNPVGQTIVLEDVGTFTVAGLIQTPPLATHLPVEVMLSLSVLEGLEKKGTIANASQNWQEYKNTAVYVANHTCRANQPC
jgi:putative ABC transport system permease protein